MTERGPNADAAESRWLTCALLVVWAVIGSWSAWHLFVLWAFSTMIDPRTTGSERTHLIADRVLWGDGFPHVAMVCALVLLTSTGFISGVVLSVSALTRHPTLKSSLLLSSGAGIMATVLIIGWLACL
jgi:hypothetical protein